MGLREGELEHAKLRICKCDAHNNGALLYADAAGCVALGRRGVTSNAHLMRRAARTVTQIFHFQTAVFARFGLTFEDNAIAEITPIAQNSRNFRVLSRMSEDRNFVQSVAPTRIVDILFAGIYEDSKSIICRLQINSIISNA